LRRIALIATVAMVLVAVPAAALGPGETVLVTQSTGGGNASGFDSLSVSEDGKCVVFTSNDAALPLANGKVQIYLRDTEAGETTLVSEGPGGVAGDQDSRDPVITPDCRYVAWHSAATNLTATPQTQLLVYRRDLEAGTNELVSRASGADGAIPDKTGASRPRMSANGDVIAFISTATNLSNADTDTNNHKDVFVRVVSANTTELVSRTYTDAGIVGPQGAGFYTSISANGRYVVFDAEAENLTAEDANSVGDVVVRDREAGTTTLVSRATGTNGAPGDYHSSNGVISADGSRVAFLSEADNLGSLSNPDPETPLDRLNVYVRDLVAGTTVLASRANGVGGEPGDADSGGPNALAISDDGTKVVFHSFATNFSKRGSLAIQSFLRNLTTNVTQVVAGGAAASQWPTISGDGTHVAFFTASRLVSSDTDDALDIYLHRYVPGAAPPPTSTPTPTPTATPGGSSPPPPAPPARPAATTLRGEAAFARGTANDLYLACTTLDLYLVDVLPAGRRVAVTGAADLRLAGRTAEILLDGKRVGTAAIGADGAFAARVKAPAKTRRRKARYQARVGSTASQKLRLARRMVATTLTRSGANLVLRGVVNPPRARRPPAIAVDRFLSCRRREAVKVPNVKPDKRGRFSVRIKVPAGANAVLYRARTKVPPRAGRPATKGTFTLPRAANVG
jgi:Tol biopolymer transport system component